MSKVEFYIGYPKEFTKKNDIILNVQSHGGTAFYGGKDVFKIVCDRSVKKQLEREIQDMLKT